MKLSPGRLSWQHAPISFVIVVLVQSLLPMLGASSLVSGAATSGALAVPLGGIRGRLVQQSVTPQIDAACRAKIGVP